MNHPGRPQPPADEVTRRLFEDASGSVVQVTGDGGRTSRGGPINGSGFFIGNDGLVATNAHVALRNNETFVRADGRLYRASVVAADDVKDVAILRLEGFQPQQARPLSVGNSTQLQSNERVFALGHPESVRSTYISPGNYRNRTNLLSVYASNGGEQRLFNAMAQVRARTAPEEFNDFNSSLSQDVLDGQVHIRPGSSGGPLLNTSGRAVGMARTMERDSRSTSYFLPIEDVTSTLNDPESNKFAFKYEFQPAPLARDYMYMWSDNPVKAAIGTGMLAGVGYTGYRAMEVRPRVM
ncbi:MAG: serine protease, partial [Cyanobacteria bacterium]|nr:serine protease [Cyanobacteriota bacterium]